MQVAIGASWHDEGSREFSRYILIPKLFRFCRRSPSRSKSAGRDVKDRSGSEGRDVKVERDGSAGRKYTKKGGSSGESYSLPVISLRQRGGGEER